MSRSIQWSPRAESDYAKLLEYLIEEWGKKSAIDFSLKLEQTLQNIVEMPTLFPSTNKRQNIRRCVITNQTTLYYRVRQSSIELITLFDTRRHPSKRKLT